MDLPTCPSCGQSVLDDEAKDCPFCGASMSGPPRAAKPTAVSSTPAAKPQQAGSAKKAVRDGASQSPAKQTVPAEDEDPFAVESAAKQNAIPLRPAPSKGRAHEVVCPMCETSGYTSTKAGGKEVRCCNAECLVPVFTAPEVKQKKPIVEPEPTGPSKAVLAGGAGLAIALIAGGIWFFVIRDSGPPSIGGNLTIPGRRVEEPPANTDETQASNDDSKSAGGSSGVNDPVTPAEIRAAALKEMQEAYQQRDNNRSRAYCLRLTAAALAHLGDVEGAQRELKRLRSHSPPIPHYEIEPLAEIAWHELSANDESALKKTLDEALAAAGDLPSSGRSRLMYAVVLAAPLAAAGRMTAAQTLIGRNEESSPAGQFAAELSAMRALNHFNADTFTAETPIFRWASPQAAAVVVALAARGRHDAAQRWAAAQQAVEVRSETTMLWADLLLQQALAAGKPVDIAAIDAAAAALPPAGRARLYARLAARQSAAGGKADALLAKAHGELAGAAVPQDLTLPGTRGLIDFRLPDVVPLRMQALAAAEIAVAECRAGDLKKAAIAVTLALQSLRASAPSLLAVERRLNEIGDVGVRAMRDRLKKTLRLNSDDEARLAFNDYRRKCNELAEAARERFVVEQAVLLAAAEAGAIEFAAQELVARSDHADLDLREPWARTRVPWMLAARLEADGGAAAAAPIQSLLKASAARRLLIDRAISAAEEQIESGRFARAARAFEGRASSQIPQALRDEWRLRLAGRLIAAGQLDAAFDFVGAIDANEASLRDGFLWFAAAQATQAGKAREVWEIGQRPAWSATEIVAIYGGLLHALEQSSPAKTAQLN